MTDFLGALVGRTLGADDAARPRQPSRFEWTSVGERAAARASGGAAADGRAGGSARGGGAAGGGATGSAGGGDAVGGRAATATRGRGDSLGAAERADELAPGVAAPRTLGDARPRAHAAAATEAAPPGADPSEPGPPSASATARPLSEPLREAGPASERSAPEPGVEVARAEATAPAHSSGSRRDPACVAAPPPARQPAEAAPARAGASPAPVLVEPRVRDRDPKARGAPPEQRPARPSQHGTVAGVGPGAADEPGAREPVVHVHIGRIEVRAPARPQPPRAPKPREPLLSLDEYLEQTTRGRR
jgi:hypothetical protein